MSGGAQAGPVTTREQALSIAEARFGDAVEAASVHKSRLGDTWYAFIEARAGQPRRLVTIDGKSGGISVVEGQDDGVRVELIRPAPLPKDALRPPSRP